MSQEDLESLFGFYFSKGHGPETSSDSFQQILEYFNNKRERSELWWGARISLDQLFDSQEFKDEGLKEEIELANRSEMSEAELAEILLNQGIDPNTGRSFTGYEEERFEEKFEKRYGNLPR